MRPALYLAAMALAASTAGLARAEPPVAAPQPSAASQASGLDASAAPLALDELADASGGEGIAVDVLTRQQLTATTSGNTVTAGVVNSGDVNLGAGALNGFNGIGNFVINTGANNTLQGAINISIVTVPGG
jgi:hypothetical protein